MVIKGLLHQIWMKLVKIWNVSIKEREREREREKKEKKEKK